MADKDMILEKINCLVKDFEMLKDETWVPDDDSCNCSIDALNEIYKYIQNGKS
jgi:hypothetical protein